MTSPDPLLDVFRMFDTDGDGLIPASEIVTPIRALGHVLTNSDMQTLLQRARVDIRKPIDLSTFRRMVAAIPPTDYARQLQEAFQVIDRDGSGSIRASDLRHLLTTLGDRMTEDEFGIILQELDIDKSGIISFSDFTYLMKR